MVECELYMNDGIRMLLFVLIDTWWNVNVEPDPFSYGTSEF